MLNCTQGPMAHTLGNRSPCRAACSTGVNTDMTHVEVTQSEVQCSLLRQMYGQEVLRAQRLQSLLTQSEEEKQDAVRRLEELRAQIWKFKDNEMALRRDQQQTLQTSQQSSEVAQTLIATLKEELEKERIRGKVLVEQLSKERERALCAEAHMSAERSRAVNAEVQILQEQKQNFRMVLEPVARQFSYLEKHFENEEQQISESVAPAGGGRRESYLEAIRYCRYVVHVHTETLRYIVAQLDEQKEMILVRSKLADLTPINCTVPEFPRPPPLVAAAMRNNYLCRSSWSSSVQQQAETLHGEKDGVCGGECAEQSAADGSNITNSVKRPNPPLRPRMPISVGSTSDGHSITNSVTRSNPPLRLRMPVSVGSTSAAEVCAKTTAVGNRPKHDNQTDYNSDALVKDGAPKAKAQSEFICGKLPVTGDGTTVDSTAVAGCSGDHVYSNSNKSTSSVEEDRFISPGRVMSSGSPAAVCESGDIAADGDNRVARSGAGGDGREPSSYRRLLQNLHSTFEDCEAETLQRVVRELRQAHNGSLSGRSFQALLRQATHMLVARGFKPLLTPPTQAPAEASGGGGGQPLVPFIAATTLDVLDDFTAETC